MIVARGDEIQKVSDIDYEVNDDFIDQERKKMKTERVMKREPAFKGVNVTKQVVRSKRKRKAPTKLDL